MGNKDSARKAAQARLNGARSSGPKSPEGLQRCKESSLTHGGYVADISTLDHEDPRQYTALWLSLHDQFAPRNIAEVGVVDLLVDALWRANRLSNAVTFAVRRKMRQLSAGSPVLQPVTELYVRAETLGKSVERLEARARHYSREIDRLAKTIDALQSRSISDTGSQMSNEICKMTGVYSTK